MNRAWITGAAALRERLLAPAQVSPQAPAGALPPYLESFLAHLRLLVGVPFEYLVPDARLLPEESIRFFYVDRSFTDRLVDGALAVGKVGTREQAHHQAQEPSLRAALDRTERVVRILQRGAAPFAQARQQAAGDAAPAQVATGFLLRSAAVANWPDMEVRAFVRAGTGNVPALQPLNTLRLERLQTSVLVALFDGVPDRVTCEEPHHGVTFGVDRSGANAFRLAVRGADGSAVAGATPVAVPFRAGGRGVVAMAELRRRLHAQNVANPAHVIAQTGAGAFAVSVLDPPWRQRFEGSGGHPIVTAGGLTHPLSIAARAADPGVRAAVEEVVG